jgi:hypothetical protein
MHVFTLAGSGMSAMSQGEGGQHGPVLQMLGIIPQQTVKPRLRSKVCLQFVFSIEISRLF